MNESEVARVVCVLGSARSGTSAVTHLMHQLGVDLGPKEHLLMELDWNTEGCWEHLTFLDVNERIFRKFGGTGVQPPVLPLDWQLAPHLEDLRARVRRTIAADFGGKLLWGWKDPTSCLTLPFWQDVVGEMQYVICVRNPIDVATSMEKHWNWSFPTAMWSWMERSLTSVLYTTGKPRLFFSFDDYFEDPERHVSRLARFLGRALPPEGSPVRERIFQTFKPELRNFRSPTDRVMTDERLTEGEKSFYLELLAACRRPEGVESDPGRLMESYRVAARSRYQRLHGQFEAYATLTEGQLVEAQQTLARVEAERDELLKRARKSVATKDVRVLAGISTGISK